MPWRLAAARRRCAADLGMLAAPCRCRRIGNIEQAVHAAFEQEMGYVNETVQEVGGRLRELHTVFAAACLLAAGRAVCLAVQARHPGRKPSQPPSAAAAVFADAHDAPRCAPAALDLQAVENALLDRSFDIRANLNTMFALTVSNKPTWLCAAATILTSSGAASRPGRRGLSCTGAGCGTCEHAHLCVLVQPASAVLGRRSRCCCVTPAWARSLAVALPRCRAPQV